MLATTTVSEEPGYITQRFGRYLYDVYVSVEMVANTNQKCHSDIQGFRVEMSIMIEVRLS